MLAILEKASPSERQRLERLLANQEATVRSAFKAFLTDARSDRTIKEVRELLELGRLEPALEIVDRYVTTFGNVIPKVITNSADAEMQALSAKLGVSNVSIGFDPTNQRAADIMRRSRLNFVTAFSREQRNTTRTALADALSSGEGPREAARVFKNSIGLTRTQQNAVDSYEDLLRKQSAQALSRELRDRRFDSTVSEAIETGQPLSNSQIDRMVDRYREQMLTYRAENIARTETLRAVSQARQEALEQTLEQAGVEAEAVRRRWVATKDARTRDSHAAMDGQEVGMDEPFITPSGVPIMWPGDPNAPASESINCRCTVQTLID